MEIFLYTYTILNLTDFFNEFFTLSNSLSFSHTEEEEEGACLILAQRLEEEEEEEGGGGGGGKDVILSVASTQFKEKHFVSTQTLYRVSSSSSSSNSSSSSTVIV